MEENTPVDTVDKKKIKVSKKKKVVSKKNKDESIPDGGVTSSGMGSSAQDVKRKKLIKLKDDINAKYNRNIIFSGTEKQRYKTRRFCTGSFWADYAMGGGIPLHRFTMFWGEESTFKTGLSLKAMADAQYRNKETHEHIGFQRIYNKEDYEEIVNPENGEFTYRHIGSGDTVESIPILFQSPDSEDIWQLDPTISVFTNLSDNRSVETYKCAIVDIEGAFDPAWFEMLGGIPEALDYTAPDYGEQAVDIIQGLIASCILDVILIDSLAMISPLQEVEDSSEKESMGRQAKLLNKAFRKWTSDMNKIEEEKRPTIIMINQRREKITMFGNPETVSGGKGQNFATSLEVRTKSSRKVLCLDKEGKYPLWQEMSGVINKNKTAPPKIEYEFNVAVNNYDPDSHEGDKKYPTSFSKGDILEHKDILKFATTYKLMGKDEENKKYFVKLLSHKEPTYYDKKGDLVDEWIYKDKYKYNLVREDLLKIMTGKA